MAVVLSSMASLRRSRWRGRKYSIQREVIAHSKKLKMYLRYLISPCRDRVLTDSHIQDYRTLVSCDARKDTCDFRFCRALLRLWAHDSLRYEIQSGDGLNDWYILW